MYDIAVILINYNSSQYTVEAINSIIEKTSKNINYQIIVVDNASSYDDYLFLKKNIETINNLQLIRSKINTGFGAGNMLGVNYADAKYYAFINNDTLVKNDCLSILFHFLKKHNSVALCAPQGVDENGKRYRAFDHFLTFRRELFGRKVLEILNPKKYPKRTQKYNTPVKVQCVPGSFLFVDANCFNQVGGFDSNIFLYYEETDLAYRISKLDYKNSCFLVPEATYIHFQGISTPKSILIKKELKLSLLYVLKKNSSYLSYFIVKNIMTIKYLFKSFVKPKYFSIVNLLLFQGASLGKSLKQSQKIHTK